MKMVIFLIMFLFQFSISNSQTIESNKKTIEAFYNAFNTRSFKLFYSYFNDSVIVHFSNHKVFTLTPLQIKTSIDLQIRAFPNVSDTISLILCEGDWVSICVRHAGINSDSLRGLPPSNKYIDYNVMEMYKLNNGKIVEIYVVEDYLSMYQQMGIIPYKIIKPLKETE